MNSTILLVDDNLDFLETAAEMLRRAGDEVETANDGYTAANRLLMRDYDLMISDVVMPGMNGPQLIGYAKQRWPELKVIAVSGEATASARTCLNELGIDGFLDKPFRMQKLLAMVKSVMNAPAQAPARYKKQVLFADDDRVFLGSAAEYLAGCGYEVTAVYDGSSAWQNVRHNCPYFAIVLDITMPKMDGLETVKAIREVDKQVNIILISGEAFADKIENILDFRACSFLRKPFAMEKLVRLIENKPMPGPLSKDMHYERS